MTEFRKYIGYQNNKAKSVKLYTSNKDFQNKLRKQFYLKSNNIHRNKFNKRSANFTH